MPRLQTKGISRAFDVLNQFIDAKRDLGVTELSKELNYSKGAIHRILVALEETGYLVLDRDSHRYRLGFKAIQLGLAAQEQNEVRRVAHPRMMQLRDATRETVTLGILVGDNRVYLEQIESRQEIRQTVEVGTSQPLYVGASGKSILAFLPAERQQRIIATASGKMRADGTPIDLEALCKDLAEIRRRGYAVSSSERLLGASSIAAPIFNGAGEVIGGLSMAGVSVRIKHEQIAQFSVLVISAAGEISRNLGYVGPSQMAESGIATAAAVKLGV